MARGHIRSLYLAHLVLASSNGCSQTALLLAFSGTWDCGYITGRLTTPAFFFCQNVSGRNMFSSLFLLQIADYCHQTHTSFRVSGYSLLLHDHHSNDIHSSHIYTHECHDDDFLSEFAHISDISEKYNPVLLLKPVILLLVPCTLNPVPTGRMSMFVVPVYLLHCVFREGHRWSWLLSDLPVQTAFRLCIS